MSVWIVRLLMSNGNWGDTDVIIGVFDSEEKANEYEKSFYDTGDISWVSVSKWTLNDSYDPSEVKELF